MGSVRTPATAGNSGKVRGAGADKVDSSTRGHDTTVYIRALEWIKANPQPWDRFVAYALNEAEHERRISVRYIAEDVRMHDYVNDAGDPCKLNNSFIPIFGRILVRDFPEVEPYIELRKSQYDELLERRGA